MDPRATRLANARRQMGMADVDAMLLTPGADLRYLTGYDAKPLERLTCLVLRTEGDPVLIVPALEVLAAEAADVGAMGVEIVSWGETHDPWSIVSSLVGAVGRVALDDRMWAEKVLAARRALPASEQVLAGSILHPMRMRKDEAEVTALLQAGEAIDSVHAQMPEFLVPGVSEREVGARITEAILASGHERVDFVIVASGPNGASPHHSVSDRVLRPGDAVVVDIGGTMPSGYCSDSTRTYALGEPDREFQQRYAALHRSQAAAVMAVRPGVTAQSLDAVARTVLVDSGLGDLFIHRTGHGIGLETHEDPYLVSGNDVVIEPGMAFSIEPGFYDVGRHGARIEDIVICTADGSVSANRRSHDLIVL